MRVFAYFILLGVGSTLLVEGEEAARRTYEVWKRRQDVHADPRSFSKVIARVEKGARLEVLAEQDPPWSRVRVGEDGVEGWTVLAAAPPPQRLAGGVKALDGGASPASLSIAVKAFEDLAVEVAKLRPDVEELFGAILGASLDPREVDDFAKAGELRAPARRSVK